MVSSEPESAPGICLACFSSGAPGAAGSQLSHGSSVTGLFQSADRVPGGEKGDTLLLQNGRRLHSSGLWLLEQMTGDWDSNTDFFSHSGRQTLSGHQGCIPSRGSRGDSFPVSSILMGL